METEKETQKIKEMISSDQKNISSMNDLNEFKVKYMGKKGIITELNSKIKDVPNEEKKSFGMKVNEVRTLFNSFYEEKKNEIEKNELNKRLEKEKIDITIPSKKIKRGSKHPMTRIEEKFEDLFLSMGYTIYDGPEIESDENCFQKLNLL